MEKELSEMTLEELWDLFPIFLVQHDDRWNGYYKEILLFVLPLTFTFIDLKYSGAVVSAVATFAAIQEGHLI